MNMVDDVVVGGAAVSGTAVAAEGKPGDAPARVRLPIPTVPTGEITVDPPPELPEPTPVPLIRRLLPLVMVAGVLGMTALMFATGAARNPMMLAFPIMMLVSVAGMVAGGEGGTAARIDKDRRAYLRSLAAVRGRVTDAAAAQRRSALWTHPEPADLWTLAGSPRRWERAPGDPDHGTVRIGPGRQRAALRPTVGDVGAVEDLDPLAVATARRLVRMHALVADLPVAVAIDGFPVIAVRMREGADAEAARALVRAMVAGLVTFHGPRLMRVGLAGPGEVEGWEWLKWLPHHRLPVGSHSTVGARLRGPGATVLAGALAQAAPETPGRCVWILDDADQGGAVDTEVIAATRPDAGFCAAVAAGVAGTEWAATVLAVCATGDDAAPAWRRAGEAGLRLEIEPDGLVSALTEVGREPFARADRLGEVAAEALARRLCRHGADDGSARGDASGGTAAVTDGPADTVPGLPELLGWGPPAEWGPQRMWRPRGNRGRLRVMIGVDGEGLPIHLDLKEAAEGGAGPHGLCIGATGSGKSEFLRTLVLALTGTHDPEDLNLVLVDFKGGATFLGFEPLPHVAAVITNLADEAALVARMQDALAGELTRRQEALRAAGGCANVGEYERVRRERPGLPPLPALVVIVDEFTEMLAQRPEFAELFVMIGRLGRSLRVHLLLASQRLDEGRIRGLETHLSYRIALRTFSASESRAVLGVPDAARLPATPGMGYLQDGAGDPRLFRAAYVSGPLPLDGGGRTGGGAVRPRAEVRPQVFTAANSQANPVAEPGSGDAGPEGADDVYATATVERVAARPAPSVVEHVVAALRGHGRPAHRVWAPPLPAMLPLADLAANGEAPVGDPADGEEQAAAGARLAVTIGAVDRPERQGREHAVLELSGAGGHVMVVGGPRSGTSTALRTLVTALARDNGPEQVAMHVIDLGGVDVGLTELPHVGTIAHRGDDELIRRIVADVGAEIRERARRARGGGPAAAPDHLFLVVDGWQAFREDFEDLEASFARIATDGLAVGVHLVVGAKRWSEMRPALRDLFGTRVELRLGEPADSVHGRRRGETVPVGAPGRGLWNDGAALLVAAPEPWPLLVGEVRAAVAAAEDAAGRARRSSWARPVLLLPMLLEAADLPAPAVPGDRPHLAPVLGVTEERAAPARLDLKATPLTLVLGDACGKSALLTLLATRLVAENRPDQLRLIVVDYRRSLLEVVPAEYLAGYATAEPVLAPMVDHLLQVCAERLPGPEVDAASLRRRDWWTGPEIIVLVDDYDLVATSRGNPLAPLADMVAHAPDVGLRLVVARRAAGAGRALYEPLLGRMRDLGAAGVVMNGAADEGALIGGVRPEELPPGRARVVTRAGTETVQFALPVTVGQEEAG